MKNIRAFNHEGLAISAEIPSDWADGDSGQTTSMWKRLDGDRILGMTFNVSDQSHTPAMTRLHVQYSKEFRESLAKEMACEILSSSHSGIDGETALDMHLKGKKDDGYYVAHHLKAAYRHKRIFMACLSAFSPKGQEDAEKTLKDNEDEFELICGSLRLKKTGTDPEAHKPPQSPKTVSSKNHPNAHGLDVSVSLPTNWENGIFLSEGNALSNAPLFQFVRMDDIEDSYSACSIIHGLDMDENGQADIREFIAGTKDFAVQLANNRGAKILKRERFQKQGFRGQKILMKYAFNNNEFPSYCYQTSIVIPLNQRPLTATCMSVSLVSYEDAFERMKASEGEFEAILSSMEIRDASGKMLEPDPAMYRPKALSPLAKFMFFAALPAVSMLGIVLFFWRRSSLLKKFERKGVASCGSQHGKFGIIIPMACATQCAMFSLLALYISEKDNLLWMFTSEEFAMMFTLLAPVSILSAAVYAAFIYMSWNAIPKEHAHISPKWAAILIFIPIVNFAALIINTVLLSISINKSVREYGGKPSPANLPLAALILFATILNITILNGFDEFVKLTALLATYAIVLAFPISVALDLTELSVLMNRARCEKKPA